MVKKSILVVIVNYGEEQLNYLQQVIDEFRTFKNYHVAIAIHSNIALPSITKIDSGNILKLDDYQLLPMTCRQSINQQSDEFDYFIYTENDHLWKEKHVEKYEEYLKILPEDRIAGLIQYEDKGTGKHYPAYHAHYDWDYNSVEEHGGKKFAHFTNVHQASFILSKAQLAKIKETKDFNQLFSDDHYSIKCKTNTDIYQYCGMKKMICISDFEDNLIHHLPNHYIDGAPGYVNADGTIGNRAKQSSDDNRMQNALKKLL